MVPNRAKRLISFKYGCSFNEKRRWINSYEYFPHRKFKITNLILTRSYFKGQPVYRCEVKEMRKLNYFFKIFWCNLHYYKHLVPKFMKISVKWFEEMAVNTVMWLNHRKQFFKGFKIIFSYYTKHASCIT